MAGETGGQIRAGVGQRHSWEDTLLVAEGGGGQCALLAALPPLHLSLDCLSRRNLLWEQRPLPLQSGRPGVMA